MYEQGLWASESAVVWANVNEGILNKCWEFGIEQMMHRHLFKKMKERWQEARSQKGKHCRKLDFGKLWNEFGI